MAHSTRRTRQDGKAGTTRNQQRKLDYAKLAAAAAHKGGGGGARVTTGSVVTRRASRTNHKPGPGKRGAVHGTQADNRAKRNKEALARALAYSKLTTKQKLAQLDAKLGVGVGATKQRARFDAEAKAAVANAEAVAQVAAKRAKQIEGRYDNDHGEKKAERPAKQKSATRKG